MMTVAPAKSQSGRTKASGRTTTRKRASTGSSRPAMSAEHKAALAIGRNEGRVVRRYLEALEEHKPRRGRKRTPDSISRRITAIETRLRKADALSRLHLMQEKEDLESELARARAGDDLAELEKSFIKVARSYGERKGISYSVWRAAGVSPAVLQRAGVIRGG